MITMLCDLLKLLQDRVGGWMVSGRAIDKTGLARPSPLPPPTPLNIYVRQISLAISRHQL